MNPAHTPQSVLLAQLRERIQRAFGNVPMPATDDITGHDCEECAELRAAFAGQDWRTLADALLEKYYSDLPLFSAEALPFFLPAYLLYAVQHFDPHTSVTEFAIYHLTPRETDDEVTRDYYRERLRYLSAEQMDIVNDFLQIVRGSEDFRNYLGDVGPGSERLNNYWEHRHFE